MSYLSTILADTPAFLLRLGEPSGTTADDSSTNNRDGSINGTPTLGLPGPCDDGATAMAFDGTNDYVTVPDGADVDGTGDFTLECWVKPGVQVDTNTKLFYKRTGGNGYALHITASTGFLTFEVEVGAVNVQINGTTDLRSAAAFYHVVAVRAGATMALYVNGVLEVGPTACSSSSVANTLALWLGSNDAVTRRFVGTGANFAFYNTALSGARIAAHFAARVTTTTAAYDALIASASPAFVVLVEVQPMEPLATWTAAGGGLTNTWYASFSAQVQTTVVPGGLYRRLDVVRQNATALISRASAALVDANLGSYFYDTAASRIYVSTASGLSPDTAALIGAWFTLFFASTSITFSDQPLFTPLVTGSLPTLAAEMPEPLFGSTVSATGSVSFLNGDGLFDRLSKQWVWRNKLATFKLGGQGLAYSDFATIAAIRINGLHAGDDEARLELEDAGTILNQTLPTQTYATWLNVAQNRGAYQPLVFGTVYDCPLLWVEHDPIPRDSWAGYDQDKNVVLVGDVTAIDRVSGARTLLTSPTDYAVIAAYPRLGWVRVSNAAYLQDTHDIIAQLVEVSIARFGSIALRILQLCGEVNAHIDDAAFTAADTACDRVLARFVNTPLTGAELLREVERSVNGQVYRGVDGRWTCRLITPDAVAPITLSDADFVMWEPDPPLLSVLNKVAVRYAQKPFGDEWAEVSASDDTVTYSQETYDSHRVDTWLTTAGDASDLAQHLRFLYSTTATRIQFEERGCRLMGASVGDLVQVTRARAPVARTGRYDGHLLRLVQLTKHLGPDGPRVTGVLDDLSGQTDQIFRLAPAGSSLTWATATSPERAYYGFLSDANGYLDAADPLTKNLKVLW